ncbi:MAG: hypothetical protein LIO53_00125 [Oscillospiraceae bacterium]|nr:hypothetical protein [Oscillospiraceae bacterium]
MADAMDTLKNILGDDAEDKIKNVMSSLSQSDGGSAPAINADNLDQFMQIKQIMENMTTNRNDPRSNLLLSLKPYMRGGRQKSIDSAVRLLGLTNITKMLRK